MNQIIKEISISEILQSQSFKRALKAKIVDLRKKYLEDKTEVPVPVKYGRTVLKRPSSPFIQLDIMRIMTTTNLAIAYLEVMQRKSSLSMVQREYVKSIVHPFVEQAVQDWFKVPVVEKVKKTTTRKKKEK
jgi:hypothetical protein